MTDSVNLWPSEKHAAQYLVRRSTIPHRAATQASHWPASRLLTVNSRKPRATASLCQRARPVRRPQSHRRGHRPLRGSGLHCRPAAGGRRALGNRKLAMAPRARCSWRPESPRSCRWPRCFGPTSLGFFGASDNRSARAKSLQPDCGALRCVRTSSSQSRNLPCDRRGTNVFWARVTMTRGSLEERPDRAVVVHGNPGRSAAARS